jgi:hypothetical protein
VNINGRAQTKQGDGKNKATDSRVNSMNNMVTWEADGLIDNISEEIKSP